MNVQAAPLGDIVAEAWRIGQMIDLAGVGYGRIHWGNRQDVQTRPYAYYFFLAGLARLVGARTAIEVGTHQGGSTRALLAGLGHRDPRILTLT